MDEVQAALQELHEAIRRADQHARAYAVGIGEQEDRQHARQRDRAALRHFIQRDEGEHGGQRDAERAVGEHARRPALFVLRDGKDEDADQQQRDDDAPSRGGHLSKFRKHDRKTPFSCSQFSGRKKSRIPITGLRL